MQTANGSDLRLWKNVFVTHIVDSGIGLKGTLFLTEHNTNVLIHWVPDPDQDDSLPSNLRKGYEVAVRDLKHLTCRRLPGFRYRALYLVLKNQHSYGPFEFRTGGATEFIQTLGQVAIVSRSEDDKTLYLINLRPPQPVNSMYQLPSDSTRIFGSRSLMGPGIFRHNALVEMGASLRRMGEKVSGSVNNFADTILTTPGIPFGEAVDEDISGTNNPRYESLIGRDRLRTTEDNDFAVVNVRPNPIPLPALPPVTRSAPLSVEQWKRHLDPYGRVTCAENLRKTIFEGGIDPTIRSLVWKYLLGYYLWDNTAEENEKRRLEKHQEYRNLKKFWKDMSHDRLVRFSLFRDRKRYIDKDVPRTDRKVSFFRDDSAGVLTRLYDILITYSIYNMDFGYFQGMNDLLAIILYVIQEEEDSFWCFAGIMERVESNFDGNLNAVREQFYQLFEVIEVIDPQFSDYLESKNAKEMPFCFRWLLIQFKREFSYKDVMMLWEAIWSEHLTKNFHILFAAAVLIMQRQHIMDRNLDANSILKYVNDLTYNIPLEQALNTATRFVKQLDQVLNSLPQSVRAIIEGPSLAASVHSIRPRAADQAASGDTSPRLDYTWGLLNEELEDLMATDDPEHTTGESSVGLMIPIPSSPTDFAESPRDTGYASVTRPA